MYEVGFPPRTLRDFLQGLRKKEGETYSNHPSLEDRVERLDDYMKERGMTGN